MAHHAEVVADEDVGESELVLQAHEQVHHLGPHRDVKGGGGLVQDEDARLDGERARDRDPLGLPARELVRKAAREAGRERDHLKQLGDAVRAARAVAERVHLQHLAERPPHGEARVERGEGILEDELDAPRERPPLPVRARDDRLAGDLDRPGGRRLEPDEQPRERRLPAAALPDHADRPPRAQLQGHPAHGPHRAAAAPARVVLDDAVRAEHQLAHAAGSFQQAAWRPAPRCRSGGSSAAQRASAEGQRRRNGQPPSSRAGSGGLPPIWRSGVRWPLPGLGREASRAAV